VVVGPPDDTQVFAAASDCLSLLRVAADCILGPYRWWEGKEYIHELKEQCMQFLPESIPPRYGFYAIGWFCFGLGIAHYIVEASGLDSFLELLLIVGMSTIVLYTAYELPDRPVSRSGQWRALLVGGVIAGAFTLLAFAVWVTWSLDGMNPELSFLLSFATALGAAVGIRASLYAVHSSEQLAKTNDLTKLLRMNQRVLRHNLRNELAIALGHLDNIEDASATDDISQDAALIREHLESLLDTTTRAREIVNIWDNPSTTTQELGPMIEAQIQAVRDDHATGSFAAEVPADCWVTAHHTLPLAIREALTNAVEHNATDVSVTVTAEHLDSGTVLLMIADTGTGIPATDREAITLPEETPLTHSRGLGLWLLYWTIQMSDGTITFEDNDPQGTVIRITLPSGAP
jgi:two-component system sensor histidine kinase RegB